MSSQDSRGGAATSLRDRRVARVIDREIAPIWHDRFARMIIRNLPSNLPNAEVMALDIHCGVGRTTAELLSRLGASARVMAIEPDDILLEAARSRMRSEWKNRVYLKAGNFDDITTMADDTYNLVVANLVLGETGDLTAALGEMIRVNRIGGRVLATLPLAGSWTEVEDIFSEVLRDAGLHAAVRRLDRLRELRPTGPQLAAVARSLGAVEDDLVIEQERFHMLFPSGREFLFAPVVEHGPLRLWKAVIGKDGTPQELFWRLKEAIDTYYTGHVLSVSVLAGLINIHVAKGTDSPGPRLAARYWRHYPTLDALWGGLAAGYVKISEPAVPFTDADLDFDLEIDDGERRTGAQRAVTKSVPIVHDDEPELPTDWGKPRAKPEPSGPKPAPAKPEPSGPKTPITAKSTKSADDFDAAFAEYNPPDEPAAEAKPAEAKPAEPAAEPRREPSGLRLPTSESGKFRAPSDPTATSESSGAKRLPTSESGKFRAPSQTDPNATPNSESSTKFRPPTSLDPSPSSESSGTTSVADLKFRPPTSDSGSGFRRPSGEASGLSPRPGEPSGFFRPPNRNSESSSSGFNKVFAPPRPRESSKEPEAPSPDRIRRNSQPLGLADVPRSMVADIDGDPATERAFDQLMDDSSREKPTRSEPKSTPDTRPAKSLMAELEAEIPKDLDEPSLVLPLESRPAPEPLADPEPKPRTSLAALEATISPTRSEPDPADEEELDEVDEVEEELDEAPTLAKPGPPKPKAPPPPPSGAFKPRPLMPILPPKKK